MKVFKANISRSNQGLFLASLLLINFVIRLLIYYNTELFRFGDYSAYLDATKRIAEGEQLGLTSGNFQLAISYLGYFVIKLFGSTASFFIFNCLMGTLHVQKRSSSHYYDVE